MTDFTDRYQHQLVAAAGGERVFRLLKTPRAAQKGTKMSELTHQFRDEQITERVDAQIEHALRAVGRALTANRLEELEPLSTTVRNLCAAYRDLRAIDGNKNDLS